MFDVTAEVGHILTGLRSMHNVTLSYVADLYRGTAGKKKSQDKAVSVGHTRLQMYGRGAALTEADSLRLMRMLVIDGYIAEKLYNTKYDSTVAYAELTQRASTWLASQNTQSQQKVGVPTSFIAAVKHERFRIASAYVIVVEYRA